MTNKEKRMKVRTIRLSDPDWAAVLKMKPAKLRQIIRIEDARLTPQPETVFFI